MARVGHLGDGLITEEMIESMRARLNKGVPGRPWAEWATTDTIRHCAIASGDDNPLWLDEQYASRTRYGGIIAPPMFPYAATSAGGAAGSMGFPGIFALHAYDEWLFYRPVRLGDKVNSWITLTSLDEKPSRWGGRAYHLVTESRFTNQNDELISVYNAMTVRAERTKAREGKKYADFTPYTYSDEEIAGIEADYDAEERRGAKPRFWEDVCVGDALGHVVKGPLTVTDMIVWWMGMGAPFLRAFKMRHDLMKKRPGLAIIDPETNIRHVPEIAHFDEKYALRSGVGAPYDVGRQHTLWFLHLLTNWQGDDGWVKYIKARFEAPNYVGDTTWVRGSVVEKAIENAST